MGFEITTHAIVGANGHVEFDLPQLQEGEWVELVVRTAEFTSGRGFGSMKGNLLYMSDDFDDPLPEFAEYQ